MSASTRIILRKKQCPESTLISHFSIKSSYPLRKKEWVDRSLSLILKLRFERLRPDCDSRGLLSKRGRISERGRKERIVHPTVAVKRTCDLSYASSRLNAVSSPRAYTSFQLIKQSKAYTYFTYVNHELRCAFYFNWLPTLYARGAIRAKNLQIEPNKATKSKIKSTQRKKTPCFIVSFH